jgi:translation elongation factor aEF-1 beta
MFVQDVDLKDLKSDNFMGEVIGLIRLMPDGVLTDDELQKIVDKVKNAVKNPAKLGKIEVKDIAFGLRGVDVTVSVPDKEGGLDSVVGSLSKIEKIDSVEVVDVGRI